MNQPLPLHDDDTSTEQIRVCHKHRKYTTPLITLNAAPFEVGGQGWCPYCGHTEDLTIEGTFVLATDELQHRHEMFRHHATVGWGKREKRSSWAIGKKAETRGKVPTTVAYPCDGCGQTRDAVPDRPLHWIPLKLKTAKHRLLACSLRCQERIMSRPEHQTDIRV